MKTTMYPVIGNCNYDAADPIIRAVRAVWSGRVKDTVLNHSLDNLESVLADHADGEHVASMEACRAAEDAVRAEWKAARVVIGEWGYSGTDAGSIVCHPDDEDAVQAAYDAIEDGDMSEDVLADVFAAGGEYVRD